jgi:hypothetical protein
LIESCSEDDLGNIVAVLDELLEHGKAIQPRHLHVEKDHVGLILADEVHGFDAVRALRQHLDAAGSIEQILQLFARQLLVVDDQSGNG